MHNISQRNSFKLTWVFIVLIEKWFFFSFSKTFFLSFITVKLILNHNVANAGAFKKITEFYDKFLKLENFSAMLWTENSFWKNTFWDHFIISLTNTRYQRIADSEETFFVFVLYYDAIMPNIFKSERTLTKTPIYTNAFRV